MLYIVMNRNLLCSRSFSPQGLSDGHVINLFSRKSVRDKCQMEDKRDGIVTPGLLVAEQAYTTCSLLYGQPKIREESTSDIIRLLLTR